MSANHPCIMQPHRLVDASSTPRSDKMAATVRNQNMATTSAFNFALALCRALERDLELLRLQVSDDELEIEALGEQIEALRSQMSQREIILANRAARAKRAARLEVKAKS